MSIERAKEIRRRRKRRRERLKARARQAKTKAAALARAAKKTPTVAKEGAKPARRSHHGSKTGATKAPAVEPAPE